MSLDSPAISSHATPFPAYGLVQIGCTGELKKLGIEFSKSATSDALRRNGLPPAPEHGGPTWRQFLGRQAGALLCPPVHEEDLDVLTRRGPSEAPRATPRERADSPGATLSRKGILPLALRSKRLGKGVPWPELGRIQLRRR